MRIHLPAETWAEVFAWIDRVEFAQKMEQLWDREYTPLAEKWLHEWSRNIKIGRLHLSNWKVRKENADGDDEGKIAYVEQLCLKKWLERVPEGCDSSVRNVPIAQVELPRNICSFKSIEIRHFDPTVAGFMNRMRPLLSKVHLSVGKGDGIHSWSRPTQEQLDMYHASLKALLPMITGPLESLVIHFKGLFRLFKERFPAVLASAKRLDYSPRSRFRYEWTVPFLADWLFTPPTHEEEEGGGQTPRKLTLSGSSSSRFKSEELTKFMVEIKKRFLAPNRRTCAFFFVQAFISTDDLNNNIAVQASHYENAATGEQLVVRKFQANGNLVLISCHQINNHGKERIAVMEREFVDWDLHDKERKLFMEFYCLQPKNRNPPPPKGTTEESINVVVGQEEKPGTSSQQVGESLNNNSDKHKRKEEEEPVAGTSKAAQNDDEEKEGKEEEKGEEEEPDKKRARLV